MKTDVTGDSPTAVEAEHSDPKGCEHFTLIQHLCIFILPLGRWLLETFLFSRNCGMRESFASGKRRWMRKLQASVGEPLPGHVGHTFLSEVLHALLRWHLVLPEGEYWPVLLQQLSEWISALSPAGQPRAFWPHHGLIPGLYHFCDCFWSVFSPDSSGLVSGGSLYIFTKRFFNVSFLSSSLAAKENIFTGQVRFFGGFNSSLNWWWGSSREWGSNQSGFLPIKSHLIR